MFNPRQRWLRKTVLPLPSLRLITAGEKSDTLTDLAGAPHFESVCPPTGASPLRLRAAKAEKKAAAVAQVEAAKVAALTVGQAWAAPGALRVVSG